MDALKMAGAIVHFRMLRSLGQFQPTHDGRMYQFRPCTCGKFRSEEIPNGIPEPVSQVNLRSIIEHYSVELGTLCRQHYS